MIEEWLGLGMMVRDPEYLDEQLLDDLPVRVRRKGLVEGQEGTGRPQTVSGHLQFGHSVDVLNLKHQPWSI